MKNTMADYITNPSSKDTDGDGAQDGRELTPHRVALRFPPPDALDCPEGKCTLPLMTSAEWRDSDGDTASDGLEETIGGDPTQSDRNNFADDDGDGLVNVQETTGWTMRFESISVLPLSLCKSVCPAGGVIEVNVASDPRKADTDGDGLSDMEEMSRGTNPSSPDSDFDGLTDREEIQGFDVPGIGTVKTNPLDSDSDNDKRSDGAEVGRTTFFCGPPLPAETCGSYIVRVQGEVPYEVAVSNPTKADADLDMLVDGDELAKGTDPTKYNTDGDTKSDYDELGLGRNPLLPDMHVTLNFARLFVVKDAESADSGDFKFDFNVVDAAGTTKPGLSYADSRFPKCADEDGWLCWFNDTPTGQRVIHINDGQTLLFPTVTVDAGLVSTSPKVPQNITIQGHLLEDDDDKEDCSVYLPDLSATGSDGTSVLNGADLRLGTNVVAIHRAVKCLSGDDLEFTLVMSYTAT